MCVSWLQGIRVLQGDYCTARSEYKVRSEVYMNSSVIIPYTYHNGYASYAYVGANADRHVVTRAQGQPSEPAGRLEGLLLLLLRLHGVP